MDTMETMDLIEATRRLVRRFAPRRWLLPVMLWLAPTFTLPAIEVPGFAIAPDLRAQPGTVVLVVTNCSDTNYYYAIQSSTNLHDWTYNSAFGFPAKPPGQIWVTSGPATNRACFYRAVMVPRPTP